MPFSRCSRTTPGEYKKLINKLRQDHLSGASELSRKASVVFVAFSEQIKAKNSKDYLDKLSKIGQELVLSKPDMVPIFNLSNSIITSVENQKSSSVECLRELTETKAQEFFRNSLTSLDRIGDYGQRRIKDNSTILTLSFSASVLSIFKKAKQKKKNFKVIVCESRPLMEGRKLALVLSSWGIEVTLIVDVAMGLFVDEANLILLGADCVTEKFFVNKIGSYPLCLLAREEKVPVYVACEKSKFIPERFRIKSKPIGGGESIGEVYKMKMRNLKIENPYFENVPISLWKKIITEERVLLPSEVKGFFSEVKISRRFQKFARIRLVAPEGQL
jgi:translation initiation factor eIF-2B subunit delta